jgi:hypothetical protein
VFVDAHKRSAKAWEKQAKVDKKSAVPGQPPRAIEATPTSELHAKIVTLTDDMCAVERNNKKKVPDVSGLSQRCMCFALADKLGYPHVMRVITPEGDRHFAFVKDVKNAVARLVV